MKTPGEVSTPEVEEVTRTPSSDLERLGTECPCRVRVGLLTSLVSESRLEDVPSGLPRPPGPRVGELQTVLLSYLLRFTVGVTFH